MGDRPGSPMRLLLVLVTVLLVTQDWAGNLTDREALKQELFVQKLASKLFLNTRHGNRMKREITSIQHPSSSYQSDGTSKGGVMASKNGHCSRKSFKINFDEIGWTHILAPKEIEYFFCEGVCDPLTVGPRVFTTSAAFVLYKLGLSPNTVIDGSCCSPSHLTSIELLVQTQPTSWDITDNPMDNLEVKSVFDTEKSNHLIY